MKNRKRKTTIKTTKRTIILIALLIITFSAYTVRLAQMQLVDEKSYRAQADMLSAQTVTIKAARGEILDRYGRPLAINREGSNIVFDAAHLPVQRYNKTIDTLCNLLTAQNEKWNDNLPMNTAYPYNFLDGKDSDVALLKKNLGLNTYASALNCYDAMVDKYDLSLYSQKVRRIIMGVRYSMDATDFSVSFPYTFAEDINDATRAKIKEASADLTGVNIEIVPTRDYVDTAVAPQILGTTGPIYAEDWEALKTKGYSFNDYLGKSGVEKAYENYLRGKNGEKKVIINKNGSTTTETIIKQAEPGNTVMLTIDKNLQKVAQNSLANLIKGFQSKSNSASSGATAGAVVVMNVNNGEILAAANYPSYDMKTYKTDYSKLLSDKSKPLFDRAFNGTYPPGSTFKPAMALIGMKTNSISPSEYMTCRGRYSYYGTVFNDMETHGSVNVVSALAESCNVYFYETGRRAGISQMNYYSRMFGLGVSTGVEIPESKGILAGPDYRKSVNQNWYAGDTVQAAIGQSDNAFTPLQLVTYTSTIANGGTRYQSHLLYEVKSYGLNKAVVGQTAKVIDTTGISKDIYSVVKRGMLSVTSDTHGTASGVFRNYPVKVGGKTGTAQTSTGKDNAVFISFAPYDKPEIAVALVIENGGHGSSSAPLARDIFNAYFFTKNKEDVPQSLNTLLQ